MLQNFTDIHELIEESQSLIFWKAPMRPFKKKGKRMLQFFLAVTFLLSVIVYFAGDPVILLPMWAAIFLFYALTITPPPIVENRITKFGVENGSLSLKWEALDHFYFVNRWGFDILCIVTKAPYYYHSYLIIPDQLLKRKIATVLSDHLEFRAHPSRSISDRLVDLLSYIVPNDEDETEPAAKPEIKNTPTSKLRPA
jgi:hypothetical protein